MAKYLIGNIKGPKGDDGVSPIAYVEQTSDGARITVQDASGTTSAELLNGQSGSYSAGENIQISNDMVISATDTTYSAGDGITIDANNRISVVGGGGEPVYYTAGEGIDITNNVISSTVEVPSKTSELVNDSNYVDGHYVDAAMAGKQNALTAGANITIENNVISAAGSSISAGTGLVKENNVISADTTVLATKTDLSGKQDSLTPGANITIQNGVISAATGETYTAGTGIEIDEGVISSTVQVPTNVSAFTNDAGYVNNTDLAGKQDTLTAGAGIDITNNTISVDNTVAMKTDIPEDELPTIASGDAGKVLAVNSGETGVEWITAGSGGSDNVIIIQRSNIPVNKAESNWSDEERFAFNTLLSLYNDTLNKIVYLKTDSEMMSYVGKNTSYRKLYFQNLLFALNDTDNLRNNTRWSIDFNKDYTLITYSSSTYGGQYIGASYIKKGVTSQ